MLTPAFEMVQDDNFLTVIIRAPYAKVGLLGTQDKNSPEKTGFLLITKGQIGCAFTLAEQ